MKQGNLLLESRALDLMRLGSALVRTNGRTSEWWIVPGGRVNDATALRIRNHAQVVGGKDALFPGLDQTWRIPGSKQ